MVLPSGRRHAKEGVGLPQDPRAYQGTTGSARRRRGRGLEVSECGGGMVTADEDDELGTDVG